MTLTSFAFLGFLALTVVAHNLAPRRWRTPVLLAASYLFYSQASWLHLLLLVAVTVTAYVGGLRISTLRRLGTTTAFVIVTLVPLLIAKYVEFRARNPDAGSAGNENGLAALVLPLGISFYTFRAISYLVDVYRGTTLLERRLDALGLYLAFFPAVLAGPIDRPPALLPQLHHLLRTKGRDAYVGAKYAAWGFFCKLVVADNVATVVDRVLVSPANESGASLTAAFVLYSFQIYFDFLGYSYIALGVARVFGVHLAINFDRPYGATSLRDFWRRWHITLSTWFRDYVYVPLGGNTTRGMARAAQILTVFVLSGLWHGAAPNFVLWGVVHGLAYFVEDIGRRTLSRHGRETRKSLGLGIRVSRMAATFAIVSTSWVFFRLTDLSDVRITLERLLLVDTSVAYGSINAVLLERTSLVLGIVLFVAIVLDASQRMQVVIDWVPQTRREIIAELTLINGLVVSLLLLGSRGGRDFVYFRF